MTNALRVRPICTLDRRCKPVGMKRRGAARPTVVACTLVPQDPGFDFGPDLAGALGPVAPNRPNCARFCVFGGASCGG